MNPLFTATFARLYTRLGMTTNIDVTIIDVCKSIYWSYQCLQIDISKSSMFSDGFKIQDFPSISFYKIDRCLILLRHIICGQVKPWTLYNYIKNLPRLRSSILSCLTTIQGDRFKWKPSWTWQHYSKCLSVYNQCLLHTQKVSS